MQRLCYFREAISLKLRILTYFDVLNTNIIMKIGANEICKVKSTKKIGFLSFLNIIISTSYRSEKIYKKMVRQEKYIFHVPYIFF